jgi:Tfp pilus assembly protein PilF
MIRPKLAVAMIVRNGGAGLARCLASVRPFAGCIVVGDTGSTDQSREIARSFDAQVLEIPWEENFARARNLVLDAVTAEWVLWLDADEMLDPQGGAMLAGLIARTDVDAWEVWRWNYVNSRNSRSGGLLAEANPGLLAEARAYPAYTRYINTLLFRRLPGLYFEHAVHESVARRVRALGLRVDEAPFVIHHFGFVEGGEAMRREKNERYHKLGLRKIEEDPQDAWAYYELGLSELEHHRDPAAAYRRFMQSLQWHPEHRVARIYAGICLTRLGRHAEAMQWLKSVADEGFRSALLAEALGDLCFCKGDLPEAVRWFAEAGDAPVIAAKRGACEVRLGDRVSGLKRIEEAVAREPEAGELAEIQAAAHFEAGQPEEAAAAAQRRLLIGEPSVSSFVVAAALEAHLGRWTKALETLQAGLQRHPGNAELLREIPVAEEKAERQRRGTRDERRGTRDEGTVNSEQ